MSTTHRPLTPATPRARGTIINRATCYAIECVIDGAPVVIGFSGRRSRAALLDAASAQSDAILPCIGDDERATYRAGVLTLGARVILRFGETERRS